MTVTGATNLAAGETTVDADEDVSVEGREQVRGAGVTHVVANANVAAAIAVVEAPAPSGAAGAPMG